MEALLHTTLHHQQLWHGDHNSFCVPPVDHEIYMCSLQSQRTMLSFRWGNLTRSYCTVVRWAAVTKYHRLVAYKAHTLISHNSGCIWDQVSACPSPSEALFQVAGGWLLIESSHGTQQQLQAPVTLIKTLLPFIKGSTLMTSHNPNYLPKPIFQYHIGGQGFNIQIWRGHERAVQDTWLFSDGGI